MAKIQLPIKFNRFMHRVGISTKKHAPTIMVVGGTVGAVASTVMACRATLKVNAILEESKEKLNDIDVVMSNPEYAEKYTEEDAKKDTLIVHVQTGVKIAKLYAPAVLVGAASIASILGAHGIMRKRNIALAAAYAAVDGSFKDYRSRVIERFGKELDRELKYNLKPKEIQEVVKNEDGTEQTVTTTVNVVDPSLRSDYARCFDETCMGWERDAEYNLIFLRQQQNYANELLKAQGYLFLNDVYKMLGIPASKAGQVVGWIYDEKNPIGDNFVDFGIYDLHDKEKRLFVNGHEKSIWLDFNVDGVVYDLLA